MSTPLERLRIVTDFLGSGHPSARIWFIGLEEAGEWDLDPERDSDIYGRYAQGFAYVEAGEIARDARRYGHRYTKVYDIMSQLVVAALGDPSLADWRAYRDHHLFRPGGHAFQMNLYPIGKKSWETWPEKYVPLFGLPADRGDYYSRIRLARFPVLSRAYLTYRPTVTICFGKTAWDDFCEVLGLGAKYDDSLKECRVYPSGVVLTPFFSYRAMPKRTIEALAQRLRQLFVQ